MISMTRNPRLPEVGEYVRTHGRLVQIEDVTPPVEPQIDYIFEHMEARVEARVNGVRLKEFGTFNDFYGEGTSINHAIEEAKEQMASLGKCDVEFVVVKIIAWTRLRPEPGGNFYESEFRKFRPLSSGWRANLPEPIEEVVWSSKQHAADDQPTT
jgi:hypothetical protein